jgi:hypothetical protein
MGAGLSAHGSMGIDTVILIRSGYRKFITYPSAYLMDKRGCFRPPLT